MKIEYVLFDVSGTLLHKPLFYIALQEILRNRGFEFDLNEIKFRHKFLSEVIHFPDRTSKSFYSQFNRELLFSLGIVPSDELIEEIFSKCSYLPWERYEDTEVLSKIDLPMGILSNFNGTLKDKMEAFFGPVFKDVFVSEEQGVGKPNIEFYRRAVDMSNIKPENILYIGDSLKLDIEPALQVGMKPLLIDRESFSEKSEFAIKNLNLLLNYL